MGYKVIIKYTGNGREPGWDTGLGGHGGGGVLRVRWVGRKINLTGMVECQWGGGGVQGCLGRVSMSYSDIR